MATLGRLFRRLSQQRESMCDDAIDCWSNLALCADSSAFRRAEAEAQSMAVAIDGVTDLRVLKAFKDSIEEGLRNEQPVANIRESLIHDLSVDAVSLPGLSFLRPGGPGEAAEGRKPLTN